MRSDPDFIKITSGLRALGGQRVWSLMVSLFGDLARDAAQTIDGPVLSAMMALLDVKPEAARVALHRLRNEGWITSQKVGRISRHQLTEKGRSESAAASPRIYAIPESLPQGWQMVLLPDGGQEGSAEGYIRVLPRLLVGADTLPLPENAVALSAGEAPVWLKAAVVPQHLTPHYAALENALSDLEADLRRDPDLTTLQIAVLRGLIVHNWRRLVLKHPVIPQPLIPKDWPGQICHMHITALLARFPRPDLP